MQTTNPILDDIARLASGVLGIASGARTEAEAAIKDRLHRLLADMDLVGREEFEAVKEMAAKARAKQEKLEARVAELEAQLVKAKPAQKPAAQKPTTKKPATKKPTGKK